MKKAERDTDELRSEYKRADFKTLVRGKYHARVTKVSNVVVLDPEVAAVFPNSESVNQVLHSLLDLAKKSSRLTAGSRGRASLRSARR